jgi:hypothetical protein
MAATSFWRGFKSPSSPRSVTVSSPFSPSDCQEGAVLEDERHHSHADEVRAVDALEALGDHGADAEQVVPFAAQSRDEPVPYSLPGEDHERHAVLLVAHGGVVDRHLLAVGECAVVEV